MTRAFVSCRARCITFSLTSVLQIVQTNNILSPCSNATRWKQIGKEVTKCMFSTLLPKSFIPYSSILFPSVPLLRCRCRRAATETLKTQIKTLGNAWCHQKTGGKRRRRNLLGADERPCRQMRPESMLSELVPSLYITVSYHCSFLQFFYTTCTVTALLVDSAKLRLHSMAVHASRRPISQEVAHSCTYRQLPPPAPWAILQLKVSKYPSIHQIKKTSSMGNQAATPSLYAVDPGEEIHTPSSLSIAPRLHFLTLSILRSIFVPYFLKS